MREDADGVSKEETEASADAYQPPSVSYVGNARELLAGTSGTIADVGSALCLQTAPTRASTSDSC